MEIATVGILGCGLMGCGIAQVCALSGYQTIVHDVAPAAVDRGIARIRKSVSEAIAKGRLPEDAADRSAANLRAATSVAEFAPCDLIIEAISETAHLKQSAYAALPPVMKSDTLLLSNTSSLGITYLATFSDRRDRFAGLHFFNPVPAMKLVEVIRGLATSDDTTETTLSFARSLGKDPVMAPDRSGFIVNRLLIPYLLDAIREVESGHGTRDDIDLAMKLGCGHPMGPLTLADFIGLDTTLSIADIMFEEYREARFDPPPLLKRMVTAGALGRKSGKGFYTYT